MSAQDLGPLDWRISITDKAGRPTPEFQRRWNTQRNNNALIGSVTFGSGPPTGTPSDGTEYVDTSTVPYTLYIGNGGSWHRAGIVKFIELEDVPSSYAGAAGQLVAVNTTTTGLEFRNLKTTDIPLLVIGFILNTGATGINVGPELIAPRAGSLTKCKIVVKSSDSSTALTFRIKQNGTDIFVADPTISAGTAGGTIKTFTNLTRLPLSVAADDLFTIDVTSGSPSWQATIQLE